MSKRKYVCYNNKTFRNCTVYATNKTNARAIARRRIGTKGAIVRVYPR